MSRFDQHDAVSARKVVLPLHARPHGRDEERSGAARELGLFEPALDAAGRQMPANPHEFVYVRVVSVEAAIEPADMPRR